MPRLLMRALVLVALCAAVASALAACGSSNGGDTTAAAADSGKDGHRGGTLTLLTSQDVQSLDPGITYSTATRRTTRPTSSPTSPPARRRSHLTARRSR